jgi:hypothetical protein
MIRNGVTDVVLGLLVAAGEIAGPRAAVALGLAEPNPPWQEAALPVLTLGIALPLLTAGLLLLLPGMIPKVLAAAAHLWILLLAVVSLLCGLVAMVTIIMIFPGAALVLCALLFGGNSVLSMFRAYRDLTIA